MSAKDLTLIDKAEAIAPSDVTAKIVELAANPAMDVAKLEKLIEMQERVMRRQAEDAFNRAFALMQSELPVIVAAKQGDKWKYAPLEDIIEVVRPILHKHGFSLSHQTEWPEGKDVVKVVGILSHVDGHSRRSEFQALADKSGSKNDIQARGSSNHYGRRYTALDLLCIVTRDADDDGRRSEAPEAPAGFDDWMADMEATAQDGLPALQKAWNDSKQDYKRYTAKVYGRQWETLKRTASKVTRG